MSGWDSYRAVYGAELRAAAREYSDHGWPVVEQGPATLLLVTGRVIDVLEVPSALGRRICAALRDAGVVVPVAGTPTGSWWYPITAGAELPPGLAGLDGVIWHGVGDAVLLPPSGHPDGFVHWRVAPALSGYCVAPADLITDAALDAVHLAGVSPSRPGAQRPVGATAVAMRSST